MNKAALSQASPPSPASVSVAPGGGEAVAPQLYEYRYSAELVEPDWRRLPGYRDVTSAEWRSALWQRKHTIKTLAELKQALGPLLPDDLAASIEADQRERATMSMLLPPQMLSTMDEGDLWSDPVRRYMVPALADRDPDGPSHPLARRDSLHEGDMWTVEGLTHRYPTKVLAELLSTCPQYCGHCTRMDLVGNNVPQFIKYRFEAKQAARHAAILDYIRGAQSVRDVVVSGGDVANLPIGHLEEFLRGLLEIEHVRDIRLATKALMGLPQHFLQDEVLAGLERIVKLAISRGVDIAVHTHVNHRRSVTPLVVEAVAALRALGIRDVRNQGVLLRGVNTTQKDLLDLCFVLIDHAKVTPYYFYMCDMIPNSEHWRIAVHEAQELQQSVMGYLPGFSTPRVVCDVPFVGKKLVHQIESYDRTLGISYWRKSYRT
ncbi:MAG: KamA family radical SAM protein, partial [Gaiellaceae bacterium]